MQRFHIENKGCLVTLMLNSDSSQCVTARSPDNQIYVTCVEWTFSTREDSSSYATTSYAVYLFGMAFVCANHKLTKAKNQEFQVSYF